MKLIKNNITLMAAIFIGLVLSIYINKVLMDLEVLNPLAVYSLSMVLTSIVGIGIVKTVID